MLGYLYVGHYLFLKAYRFLQALLSESYSSLGTVNICRQILDQSVLTKLVELIVYISARIL